MSERMEGMSERTPETMMGRVVTAMAVAGFLFLRDWGGQILNACWIVQNSLLGVHVKGGWLLAPKLSQNACHWEATEEVDPDSHRRFLVGLLQKPVAGRLGTED